MNQIQRAYEKFTVLREVVESSPELIDYFNRKEATAKAMLEKYGAKKQLISSLHKELSIWVEDLLEPSQQILVKQKFQEIDSRVV